MPSRYHRSYWQMAQRIHAQLTNPGRPNSVLSLPEETWNACTGVLGRLKHAQVRRWPTATQTCHQRLTQELTELKHELSALITQLSEQARETILSLAEIYRELVNLDAEFADVCLDVEHNRLSVTTAPIVLDDYHFGPFRIELDFQSLSSSPQFRVIALQPSPAGCNSEVTHPHVSGERLCLGAGRQAVAAALAGGRLCDFFTIVDRLLHTYARGQAYVELADWQGTPCVDCGATADEDDRYGCDRCEEVVCTDCFSRCESCERILCGGCTTSCQHCDQFSCHRCLAECAQCGANLCSSCFETPETCQKCHAESQSEDSPFEPEPTADGNPNAVENKLPTAVPTDVLGQVAVPA